METNRVISRISAPTSSRDVVNTSFVVLAWEQTFLHNLMDITYILVHQIIPEGSCLFKTVEMKNCLPLILNVQAEVLCLFPESIPLTG